MPRLLTYASGPATLANAAIDAAEAFRAEPPRVNGAALLQASTSESRLTSGRNRITAHCEFELDDGDERAVSDRIAITVRGNEKRSSRGR